MLLDSGARNMMKKLKTYTTKIMIGKHDKSHLVLLLCIK